MGKVTKLRGIIAATMLAAVSQTAQAEGEPSRFNGFYAGLVGGYAAADETWGTAGTGGPARANLSLDGGLGGITVGHNWNMGDFVLGLEADATTLSLSDSNVCSGMAAICTVDLDAMVSARARVGFLFGTDSQFMAYATGGLSAAWIDVNNPGTGTTTNYTKATYTVGGGFEGYVLGTDWVSTKLEYLYVGLDDARTYTIGAGTGTLDFDGIHVFRWGWNFQF